jgi:dTDP-4-dehydrorhamnose reductase
VSFGSIAVTGAGGRLGSALVGRLGSEGRALHAWSRPEYDLDRPRSIERLVRHHRPAVVIHAAAWTDVDGCARDPDLAQRRNGQAVGVLARACRRAGSALVLVSTNEVFDGERTDRRGYLESDEPHPGNPYGASKLAGERQAAEAFGGSMPDPDVAGLWIVRTCWLFGAPSADFPRKILAAAERLPRGAPLRVVDDEIGSPTYATDLAEAILRLIEAVPGGLYHLVNGGAVSRFGWAARIFWRCRPPVALEPISRTAFVRASSPPAWAVLDGGRAAALGVQLRPWEEAFDAYAPSICP